MFDLTRRHYISMKPVDGFPADAVSVVGHPDTAAALGVAFNRVSLKLSEGDVLYVAQLNGGRLPEGCTTLPEGFSFTFLEIKEITPGTEGI